MSDTYNVDMPASLVPMSIKKLMMVILAGALAGLVTWGLATVFDMYIYKAILCNNDAAIQCASSYQYASTTATIIGLTVGLFGLVRLHVFRPLLIIIAVLVSLWGLLESLTAAPWYVTALATAGLYGVAFGAYAWFVRVRRFYIALIVVLVIVVAIRLILNS